ncbi:Uncharacterized protein TCM_035396 [Theobroma cacao]|uniref:Uncharacterized protein n=1 Tax=Theobroma cacao TaxID=3641 RepID=A0A061FIT6_THECC|nr:Uncharacterized protein TCM_035396 [Theobroma cacao]
MCGERLEGMPQATKGIPINILFYWIVLPAAWLQQLLCMNYLDAFKKTKQGKEENALIIQRLRSQDPRFLKRQNIPVPSDVPSKDRICPQILPINKQPFQTLNPVISFVQRFFLFPSLLQNPKHPFSFLVFSSCRCRSIQSLYTWKQRLKMQSELLNSRPCLYV